MNLVKSPKKHIFAELSWSKVEVVPKYQLTFLNFLHQSSSPCVQPNLAGMSSLSLNLPANTSSARGDRETHGQRARVPSLSHVGVGETPAQSSPLVSLCAYLFSHRNWHSWWGSWDDSHKSGVVHSCEGSISEDQGMQEETRYSHLHRHTVGPHSGGHSLRTQKQSLVSQGLVNESTTAEFWSSALT